MKDFWEETSWPRDSSNTSIRNGVPVIKEEDLDAIFLKEQLEMESGRVRLGCKGGMDDKEVTVQSKSDKKNPYVTQIVGVECFAESIISKQKSLVVFMAM